VGGAVRNTCKGGGLGNGGDGSGKYANSGMKKVVFLSWGSEGSETKNEFCENWKRGDKVSAVAHTGEPQTPSSVSGAGNTGKTRAGSRKLHTEGGGSEHGA